MYEFTSDIGRLSKQFRDRIQKGEISGALRLLTNNMSNGILPLNQGGQRLEKPWKTLKSLEFVTEALKTLKNCLFNKKKLEKHEFSFKKP